MRKRWVQDKESGRLIEVPADYKPPPRKAPWVRGDIEPFISPVDRKPITTRSELRAHNRIHNVVDSREYDNSAAIKERHQKIRGEHKATNEERLKDVIAAWKQETGDL